MSRRRTAHAHMAHAIGRLPRTSASSSVACVWLARHIELAAMVWCFERESERLQYEIRREQTGGGYELVIRASADEKTVQKVASPSELIERAQDVWNFLLNGGWRPLAAQTPPST